VYFYSTRIFFFLFLGKSNWENKAVTRAISAEKFKQWRPFVYEEVRSDYVALNNIPAFPGK